jgi:hypothetical protein
MVLSIPFSERPSSDFDRMSFSRRTRPGDQNRNFNPTQYTTSGEPNGRHRFHRTSASVGSVYRETLRASLTQPPVSGVPQQSD